jgi:large subunit ribosomal protein L24
LFARSKLLCSHLSKDLQKKYSRRSIRITEGDTVKILRGEYKGVTGKITRVSTEKNGAAVEGIKKEKLKGGNLDVFIHASNLLVTDVGTGDPWRQNKLEGKPAKPKETKAPKPIEAKESEPRPEPEKTKKTQEKKNKSKTKESKVTEKRSKQ